MQWHTPIGYSIRDGKIIVNEEHSKVVKKIFTDYDAGISLIRIAEDLKEQKILPKHPYSLFLQFQDLNCQ